MTDFVADCSIGIAWIHPQQATPLSARLLIEAESGATIHVPSLWHLEIANALLVAVRRKLITEPHRQLGLSLLGKFKIVIDHNTSSEAFSTISELAIKHSLSAYDAAYLELSRRKTLPLATRDEPLKAAAKKAGLKVL